MFPNENLESWSGLFNEIKNYPFWSDLSRFLLQERRDYNVFPKQDDIFNAFKSTNLKDLKVVIIGQDPYHGLGEAHGLAFSTLSETTPSSLKNIFKEIKATCRADLSSNNLENWANQGVLLLNRILTVREDSPNSHKNKGWELFTNAVVRFIVNYQPSTIFVLWGNNAQELEPLIPEPNVILKSVHPSPLSAHRGFLGCGHFKKINDILLEKGEKKIDWSTGL